MPRDFKIRVLRDQPISANIRGDGPRTCAYPNPCRISDGAVLCAYRGGSEKHSRDGVLLAQRSEDGGATWSEPVTVFDGLAGERPESVHAGVVCEPSPGRVLAIFKTVEAKDPNAYIFSEAGRRLRQQLYVSRSMDAGRTWLPAEPGEFADAPRDHYIGIPPVVLPGGALIVPIEATGPKAEEMILVSTSRDEGRTFGPLLPCMADPTGAVSYGDARYARLPDGRIVALAWTFGTKSEQTHSVHRTVSNDDGRTWSAPASIGVASQIMAPLALDDGRMIAVSNVRIPPEGTRLWLSHDDGETWDTQPIVLWDARSERLVGAVAEPHAPETPGAKEIIWAALPGFTFGTPDLVRVGRDRFVMTYYATVADVLHIRACSFELVAPR